MYEVDFHNKVMVCFGVIQKTLGVLIKDIEEIKKSIIPEDSSSKSICPSCLGEINIPVNVHKREVKLHDTLGKKVKSYSSPYKESQSNK